MGGTILEHESKTIYKEGWIEGWKEGWKKGWEKSWKEGYKEGWREGYKEGRMEVKQSVTQRLFQKGIKPETIADFVAVSVDLVEEWISALGHPTGKKI